MFTNFRAVLNRGYPRNSTVIFPLSNSYAKDTFVYGTMMLSWKFLRPITLVRAPMFLYIQCVMQNFKINAQLCIEFTFYLSITSFLNIQVQNLLYIDRRSKTEFNKTRKICWCILEALMKNLYLFISQLFVWHNLNIYGFACFLCSYLRAADGAYVRWKRTTDKRC